MSKQSTNWFSIVPIAAVLFIFIGWNIHGSTSGGNKTFSDESIGLTFDYSSQWIRSAAPDAVGDIMRMNDPDLRIHVVKLKKSLIGMQAAQNSFNKMIYKDYNLRHHEPRDVSGMKAHFFDYTFMGTRATDQEGEDVQFTANEVVVDLGDYKVVITYSAPTEKFEEGLGTFNSVIASVQAS
jgi:hypothetical protein